MKRCNSCGQLVGEFISTCPSCGLKFSEGLRSIDGYRIQSIIHEGHSSILCRAMGEEFGPPVMIRLFKEESGVDDAVAARLERELEELKKLPADSFVRHFEIKRSDQGLWYRVSEWVNAESWGSLLASNRLKSRRARIELFLKIASALAILHKRGHVIPHLILNDIMVVADTESGLQVKIDYKLSRFLAPKMDRPGPMLKRLLACHPDIVSGRALDYRTDIWSLGKVFVEILSADLDAEDFTGEIDKLEADQELKVLLKVMLADDPDLRPASMAQIASTLEGLLAVDDRLGASASGDACVEAAGETRRLRRINWLLGFALVVCLVSVVWIFLQRTGEDSEHAFSRFVETYAGSIAFVMVEYWAQEGDTVVYRNRIEGTAFLADRDGYLLTNRHIACPWLEDSMLFTLFHRFQVMERDLEFRYRTYVWFEGKKAFNRLPAVEGALQTSDRYHLATAYSTGKPGQLRIAGIPRGSTASRDKVLSPFRNDFAVLKIDTVPEGLTPLPLASGMDPETIPRLSPVIVLGFPLGSQTQDDSVNFSVTRGSVRRTFKDVIQVDSSIYRGNSGGPVIDASGKVIGIATAVASEQNPGMMGMTTPLYNIGIILPIRDAFLLMNDLKAGGIKWDGVLDFSLKKKLDQIEETAFAGNWAGAVSLAEEYLETSFSPPLVFSAAMLHFCSGNPDRSRQLFEQALSMEPDSSPSKVMLTLLDSLQEPGADNAYTRDLLLMDWRSRDEFFGHLAHVLRDRMRLSPGEHDWETPAEKSWRLFIDGFVLDLAGDLEAAGEAYRQAALSSPDDSWVYFLSTARFEAAHYRAMNDMADAQSRQAELRTIASFRKEARQHREEAEKRRLEIESLESDVDLSKASYETNLETLQEILGLAPENREILARIVFLDVLHGRWENALPRIDAFLDSAGRETALSLDIGLLKGIVLRATGRTDEAMVFLSDFLNTVDAPWYRAIGESLTGRLDEKTLLERAEESPENLLTAHAALGLWAEATGDLQKAANHYREALLSYLDHRPEFTLVLGRMTRLREATGER